jgi:POT family proton-dependent oligopeptide transporter
MQQEVSLEEIQNFKGKYPRQLWFLFLSEMWERFSFYGMRGMLVVFMVTRLMQSEKQANLRYGAIQALVYTFTFIGGLFADKILGFRKSLFWGGSLMIIGSFILAFQPEHLFYIGISFTVIGTGFFKPNISTMVGNLYADGDVRRDTGFSLFYSGINLGALLGGFFCILVGKNYSWNLAFSLAGIGMVFGLLLFIFTQRTMGPIGQSPLLASHSKKGRTLYELGVYALSLAMIPFILLLVSNTAYTDKFMYIVGPVTLVYIFWEIAKLDPAARKKMYAALILIIFSILFWAFYEQSGGSLNLFSMYNLHDHLLGMKIDPNGLNNSANSLYVIAFSPLIGLIWYWMAQKNREPNTVVKFGIGFLFLGISFYILYATRFFADASGMTSLNVFAFAYLVMTLGELCLSPIGLSIMTKLSPQRLWGVMMGLWFLASAYGQYVAGLLGADMSSDDPKVTVTQKLMLFTDGYKHLGLYGIIAGVVMIAISPMVRKLMQGVK